MKKIWFCALLFLTLAGCDNTSTETKAPLVELQGGVKVPSGATEIKNYIAEKNASKRQHYIFDFDKSMSSTDEELTRALAEQGYSRQVKSETDEVVHLYFKKNDASTIVAILKPAGPGKTRLAMSWEVQKNPNN
ncbi:hypothetical protein [Pseudomonas shahriarae]|uniref:hypothetical protein n=1 Tax=Pseudomonas shahriarae TaxID=2745512 RepID=UPI00249AC0D0|nr:hypothetical protein [Pseudomonas shahriarae]MDI3203564.1 hypothetical protein [Pseudomonas shahriarae]